METPIEEDNQGRSLSPQQAEFFKDSKVVDKDGRLMVMYHVSDHADIGVFQSGNSAGLIYFAQTERAAKAAARGSKITYPCYLNVTNPVNTADTPVEWYNAEDSRRVSAWRNDGYDGVYVKDESGVSLAVFSPGQIKSVDNKAPTKDPDIRYSVKGGDRMDREAERVRREGAAHGKTVLAGYYPLDGYWWIVGIDEEKQVGSTAASPPGYEQLVEMKDSTMDSTTIDRVRERLVRGG